MFFSVSLSSQNERINKKEERRDHQSLTLAETFFSIKRSSSKEEEKKNQLSLFTILQIRTRPLTQMQN